MYCRKCGKKNSDDATFCSACAERLWRESDPINSINDGNITPKIEYGSANGNRKLRGTSIVPLVLGVISGIIGMPASLCSGMCAAMVDVTSDSSITEFYLYGTALISLMILVCACMTRKFPIVMGVIILILSGIGVILFGVTINILGIIAMILSVLSGIFSLTQKKEYI